MAGTRNTPALSAGLEPRLKDFFYKDFDNENYTARRREVLQRLQLLLDNDAMNAMLSSVVTRFTFDEAWTAARSSSSTTQRTS